MTLTSEILITTANGLLFLLFKNPAFDHRHKYICYFCP